METLSHLFPWLELMERPAFCVKNGVVAAVNSAAQQYMLREGMAISEIITEHRSAYEEFQSGSLYLTITACDLPCSACVTRTKECDVFVLSPDTDDDELQALALAAQQLRIPISNMISLADPLLDELESTNPDARQQTGQIKRSLYQLLRIVGNMSDAGGYRSIRAAGMQSIDLSSVIGEIMEKAQTLSESAGVDLSYVGPNAPILGLANEEKLGRAIYNLLSNALKFSPQGSTVETRLTQSGTMAIFTICNINIVPADDQSFWNRYRRAPAVEDHRYGLGLGMTLVSAVASAHGGTVLIDHPDPYQTRITMTIAIVKDNSGAVRSPILRISDYAGGWDKGLMELSEILPTNAYEKSE